MQQWLHLSAAPLLATAFAACFVVIQEIAEKAPQLPQDIKWHFIGHLQSNKAKTVVGEHDAEDKCCQNIPSAEACNCQVACMPAVI